MKHHVALAGLALWGAVGAAQAQAGIGYKSVAEARAALTASPGVQTSQQNGWLIVIDKANGTVWSFSPPNDQAYPAVVKRKVVQREGGTFIDMNVLCEAPKAACDKLVEDFKALNAEAGKAAGGR